MSILPRGFFFCLWSFLVSCIWIDSECDRIWVLFDLPILVDLNMDKILLSVEIRVIVILLLLFI